TCALPISNNLSFQVGKICCFVDSFCGAVYKQQIPRRRSTNRNDSKGVCEFERQTSPPGFTLPLAKPGGSPAQMQWESSIFVIETEVPASDRERFAVRGETSAPYWTMLISEKHFKEIMRIGWMCLLKSAC